MKIELTEDSGDGKINTVIIDSHTWGEDIFEVCELLRQALLGIGFHPDSVKEGFNDSEDTEVVGDSGEEMESKDNGQERRGVV
jgi:hypothetical protein